MVHLNDLRKYSRVDEEKRDLLSNLISSVDLKRSLKKVEYAEKYEHAPINEMDMEFSVSDMSIDEDESIKSESIKRAVLRKPQRIRPSKYCPQCGRKFPADRINCPDCLIKLKNISDKPDVKSIKSKPEFEYSGSSDYESFDELFCEENINLVNDFAFTIDDYNGIVRDIKALSFANLNGLVTDNGIFLDDLEILDAVILYAKSFVEVDYKSYGSTLGYYEYNRISVDDRQRKSLQITTIIHELTHFLIKEILARTLCRILDTTKNEFIESFITYVLSYSPLNQLIDEYAAHTVEGRFTVLGYQDYSSFISLQDALPEEDVEVAKMIGNSFSVTVKDILESFLDWDLREEIKEQFLSDTIERPNYAQLRFESCKLLTDEGLIQAIWLILSEGFAKPDYELLERYRKEF